MGTKYNESESAKETGSSIKAVSETWHQAREDARACGELNDKLSTSPSPNAKNEPDVEKVVESFWKSLGF